MPAYPPASGSQATHKHVTKTTSGPNASSTWANVDTATDIVLTAAVGDVILVGFRCNVDNGSGRAYLDVATIVSGAVVSYFGGAQTGGDGTVGDGMTFTVSDSDYDVKSSSGCLTLGAGDISLATVTLRLRFKSLGNKKPTSGTNGPLKFYAKNLGPAAA